MNVKNCMSVIGFQASVEGPPSLSQQVKRKNSKIPHLMMSLAVSSQCGDSKSTSLHLADALFWSVVPLVPTSLFCFLS